MERNNVSRLVGLTAHGKRFLGGTLGVRTLPELSTALQRPDADDRLQRCAVLAGERPRLEARLVAYATASPVRSAPSTRRCPWARTWRPS